MAKILENDFFYKIIYIYIYYKMSLYSQYAGGIKDSVKNTYNLLVTGGSDYPQSAGIILGNSTITGASTRLYQDVSSNAYVDFQAPESNSLAFRYTSNGSTFSNMLTLMNDTKSSSTINAATTNGRMAASQFISTGDARAPSQAGLYVYQNNSNGGQFGMAGTTSGFNFSNYNSNGTLNNTALVLNSNGSVLTPYYNQTMYGGDNEANAVVTMDTSGNFGRGWTMNQRLRNTENDTQTIYNVLNAGLPNTVNNIINRLNGLSMYSSNLAPMATITAFSNITVTPSPTPTPTQTPTQTPISTPIPTPIPTPTPTPIPITVPGAPTIGTVSVTNKTTVSVPFTSGTNGGATITSYVATSTPSIVLSVSGTASPLTITGTFVIGVAYTFVIAAVNSVGTGPYSSLSNSVTPYAYPLVTGGTRSSDATYYYNTFLSNGTLSVTNGPLTSDILIVAGGGGGGGGLGAPGGGGGAGGVFVPTTQSLSGAYTCTVGSGGSGTASGSQNSTNGANSQFGALTVAVGGGSGAYSTNAVKNGADGGSGGGGYGYQAGSAFGGASTQTSTGGTGYGHAGSNGTSDNATWTTGGSGGGAGTAATNSTSAGSGAAGLGINAISWTGGTLANALSATGLGVSGYIAGGGSGYAQSGTQGSVNGGGGIGATTGTNGTANTGGGGGGGTGTGGGNGGSGFIIVRYTRAQVGG